MINLNKYNIQLLIDFDSTFIKSESLEIISEISLKDSIDNNKTIKKIKELTNRAMNGDIPFSDALIKRIKLLKANKEHINLTIDQINNQISDSFKKNKKFFQENCENCYIISGGFLQIIKPIMKDYNIPEKNIFANELIFDKDGYITSINKKNPLSKNLGKIEIAKKIKGEKIIIGDGYTDYEIKKYKFASKFIQHIENINRKNLNSKADLISNSLDESISYIIKEYE
tara:strand:- start:320 stop:1003 length:684 start_codon:yes stop_codon:yes gene_type:complete